MAKNMVIEQSLSVNPDGNITIFGHSDNAFTACFLFCYSLFIILQEQLTVFDNLLQLILNTGAFLQTDFEEIKCKKLEFLRKISKVQIVYFA